MAAVRFIVSILLTMALVQGLRAEDLSVTEWQKRIDEEPHPKFNDSEGSVLSSLRYYRGKCQIQMTYDPANVEELTFKFVRDGKEILILEGHFYSVFRMDGDVLFFAKFDVTDCGCELVAYDLSTGQKLWSTQLKGVGLFDHSLYRNVINMDLAPGVVWVTGFEGGGDYIEIVDEKTGKPLAHRVFAPTRWKKK